MSYRKASKPSRFIDQASQQHLSAAELKVGRIRARRHEAIEQLIPAMMLGNIACGGALALLLWRIQPATLLIWCSLIVFICGYRLSMAVRKNVRPPYTYAPIRLDRKRVRQSAVMAIIFVSVPAWLLTQSTGARDTCVVAFIIGLQWAGGLILAPVLPAAITYVSLISVLAIAGLLAHGCDMYSLYLSFLFVAGGLTVLGTAKRQSALFTASHQQQAELEEQGVTIGVLLRDFEDQTSDWLWEIDSNLRYQNLNSRFVEALGKSAKIMQKTFLTEILADENVEGNTEARRVLLEHVTAHSSFRDIVIPMNIDGISRWWAFSGRPFYDGRGSFQGYHGVCADITFAKQAEARFAYLAHHDTLTGLSNRTFFCDRLNQELQGASTEFALLSLDLDGFKGVNDRYGHPAGDALLVSVAQRLRTVVEGGGQISRFGGDEFVILDTSSANLSEVEALARNIVQALSSPFVIAGEDVTIGVSIGVAVAPADGDTAFALIKNADAALYRAKDDGRGTFRFFEPEMDLRLQERQRLVQDLRLALARQEFVLHYQPYVTARTGRISGWEALVRWQHPERGMITPAEFIPVAERSGLIVPIGAWILNEACRVATCWPSDHRISVNISPVQFRDPELPRLIRAALASSGLSPSRLEIEVTESVLIDDVRVALKMLEEVRALNVRIALDDFGTGYSSLSYLRMFLFDKIKIDRSFVKQLDTRRDHQVIVQAICDMAHGLGMSVTAEGVETAEQSERLQQIGCEELQGHYFGKPKPLCNLAFENGRKSKYCGQLPASVSMRLTYGDI